MVGKMGQLLRPVHGFGGGAVDVERAAVTLAEEDDFPVRRVERATVLAGVRGQPGVLARGSVIAENVARDGGGVVLAPDVLAAGAVLIQERGAVPVETEAAHGSGNHLLRAAAGNRDAVQLRHPFGGKQRTGSRVLDDGGVIDVAVVRGKGEGGLLSGVGGHPMGHAAAGGDGEDVAPTVAVGDECQRLPVVRPHGRRLEALPRGEPLRRAAAAVHYVNVPFVSKGYLRAVGRDGAVAHPQRRSLRKPCAPDENQQE